MTDTGVDFPALDIQGLNSFYGESHILHDISLTVRKGEVVSLLGRNGAGKTTLLKSIAGMIRQKTGSIRCFGTEIVNLAPHKIANHGIALCPEERGIYSSLTVEENLFLPPIIRTGGMELDQLFELFPNLKERLKTRQGSKLSGGEQQMLAIARILRTGADIILLDEPSEGLAPVIVQQIGKTIETLKSRGFTVVLVEQNYRFGIRLADRNLVIEDGKIIETVTKAEVPEKEERIKTLLGV